MKTETKIVGSRCIPILTLMRTVIVGFHLKTSVKILVLGLTFTFLLSCANQENIILRYKMEEGLFKSEKFRQVLFINLKVASPEDFKRVIDSYQEVVNLASQVKPPLEQEIFDLSASAQLRISELYYLHQYKADLEHQYYLL